LLLPKRQKRRKRSKSTSSPEKTGSLLIGRSKPGSSRFSAKNSAGEGARAFLPPPRHRMDRKDVYRNLIISEMIAGFGVRAFLRLRYLRRQVMATRLLHFSRLPGKAAVRGCFAGVRHPVFRPGMSSCLVATCIGSAKSPSGKHLPPPRHGTVGTELIPLGAMTVGEITWCIVFEIGKAINYLLYGRSWNRVASPDDEANY